MLLRLMTIAVAFIVMGSDFAEPTQVTMFDKQQFAAYDAQVKSDLSQGTRYQEISAADQDKAMKILTDMEQRWQKADSEGKLNVSDSVDMVNDQEMVVTLLQHAAADSRRVCNVETPMGTKVRTKICRTVAQMKREQNDSQDALRNAQQKTYSQQSGN